MAARAAGGPGSGRRWLILAGIAVVAILALGFVALTFFGSQAAEAQRGTVEFGTGGSECTIEGRSSTFPAGIESIYEVAHLAREVEAGEVVTFRVSQDQTELASVPRTFDAAGDCLGGELPGALLTPGQYRVEYLVGTETLAAGTFDVVP